MKKNVCVVDDLMSALEFERDCLLIAFGPSITNVSRVDFPKMTTEQIFATGKLGGIKTAMDLVETSPPVYADETQKLESTIEDLENQIEGLKRESRN